MYIFTYVIFPLISFCIYKHGNIDKKKKLKTRPSYCFCYVSATTHTHKYKIYCLFETVVYKICIQVKPVVGDMTSK